MPIVGGVDVSDNYRECRGYVESGTPPSRVGVCMERDTPVSACVKRRVGGMGGLDSVAEVTDGVRADSLAADAVLLEQPRQVGALQAERLGRARLIPVGFG